jgi:hypothetical protein
VIAPPGGDVGLEGGKVGLAADGVEHGHDRGGAGVPLEKRQSYRDGAGHHRGVMVEAAATLESSSPAAIPFIALERVGPRETTGSRDAPPAMGTDSAFAGGAHGDRVTNRMDSVPALPA